MNPPRTFAIRLIPAAVCLLVAAAADVIRADVVTRRNGTRVEGRVVSVDADAVVVETDSGRTRLLRSDVATVSFEAVAPPLKVEIRNVRADDAADLLVEGEAVIVDAREGGSWIDVTSKLKEGNNRLGLRIRNDRGTWAYRFHVRINGTVVPVACGTPMKQDDPCTAWGHSGLETGTFEVGPIWLNVDRALGRAELLP
ncbi:MAG TPA: hypothetical protein VF139_18320 [Candidatus Polarisedimenticolaceae bacterium]